MGRGVGDEIAKIGGATRKDNQLHFSKIKKEFLFDSKVQMEYGPNNSIIFPDGSKKSVGDLLEVSEKSADYPGIFRRLLLDEISDHLGQTSVTRSSTAEVKTGLEERNKGKAFRHQSLVLQEAAQDPQFADEMQVMIDLDSTLFPLDRAMREMGVDLDTADVAAWGDDGDQVGDLIVKNAGREDLVHRHPDTEERRAERADLLTRAGREDLIPTDALTDEQRNDEARILENAGRGDLIHREPLTEEENKEKIDILVDFFAKLHADDDLMTRAGVYEYAPQIVRDLRAQGVRVHIVTHRSPEAAASTIAWLQAMGIEYDEFICDLPHKADKVKYCQEQSIPVVLDDKPKTIADMEASGIEVISLAWPYSQKALEEHDGDEAWCWREMGDRAVGHLERIVSDRAKALGVDLIGRARARKKAEE